jgi:hypothetical protein
MTGAIVKSAQVLDQTSLVIDKRMASRRCNPVTLRSIWRPTCPPPTSSAPPMPALFSRRLVPMPWPTLASGCCCWLGCGPQRWRRCGPRTTSLAQMALDCALGPSGIRGLSASRRRRRLRWRSTLRSPVRRRRCGVRRRLPVWDARALRERRRAQARARIWCTGHVQSPPCVVFMVTLRLLFVCICD